MANKRDKTVRGRIIRDKGVEARLLIAAVVRHSRWRDSVECPVSTAVLAGLASRDVNAVIAKIAMDAPAAAGLCGPKPVSLVVMNRANVVPVDRVVRDHLADRAR